MVIAGFISTQPSHTNPFDMPQPSTPSPYRFAKKRDVAESATSKRFVPSKLRNDVAISTPQHSNETRQFAHAPRFSSKPTQNNAARQVSPTPDAFDAQDVKAGLRTSLRRVESIHDASQESEQAEKDIFEADQGDDDDLNPVDSTNRHNEHFGESTSALENYEHEDDITSPSKRRRLSPVASASTHSHAPATVLQTPRRFLSTASTSQQPPVQQVIGSNPSSTTLAPSHQRPPFLRPPPPPTQPEVSEPLPDAFSPRRRGNKFVPGGMAETMRGWIMDTAQVLRRNNEVDRWGPRHDAGGNGNAVQDDGTERFRIAERNEVAGPKAGVALLRGVSLDREINRTEELGEADPPCRTIMLVESAGKEYSDIRSGDVVSILPPHWEISVDGEPCRVAIEWQKD
ncbi:hypothetical protein NA57DRAFT_79191 [Rhizodiscina lignyota]|uniref:Uncharacterized protein n=1 Tax=Rhizodiscina lignyota TaxID=1504668 RepID=A0A9P4I973_9PEZI|nr:hypothetical protein NA57DRAFT_79191 [Rhizodiscina lignyota]